MNRELQFKLYQDFIVNCTTVSKSVKNYSDFRRINECLSLLFPAKKDVSILDFDNPEEFKNVIGKLLIQNQFVNYDQNGKYQYSNTLKYYLRFLDAKMMFSKTSNLASNNIDNNLPLQTIFYGAPSTGKSHKVNELTKGDDTVIRTTFHPDYDYASFVGCYKPVTKEDKHLMQVVADFATKQAISIPVLDSAGNTVYDTSITYQFTQQAFLKAYIQAWKKMQGFKAITTSSLVSVSGSASTPYKVSGKSGTHTSFNFASQNGATLSKDEQKRLLEVDNFGFPFDGLDNFGKLHNEITVIVTSEPTEEQEKRKRYIEEIAFSAVQIRELYAKYYKIANSEEHGQERECILIVLQNILQIIANKLRVKLDDLKDYNGDDVTITIDSSEGGYGSVNLLGLFDPNPDPTTQKKTIYLFKNNIGNKLWLLCAVYIHEMFHAYYHICHNCTKYVPEIEEPIVECNTLCFLELFEKKDSPLYLNSVKKKRISLAINYYGFGSCLFENRSLDWMKLYKEGWNNIDENSDSVKQYVNKYFPIYPFGDESDTMNRLYNILNPQSKTTQIPAEQQQYLVIEEINRGNCAQIFGDIFQLLDRNDAGFSTYPIVPDADITRELKTVFASLDLSSVENYINGIFSENYPGGIVDKIKSGELLVLPCNLNLLATMNTSDQSLFPMDSAFKRRWDWEFVPIRYSADEAKDGKDNFHTFEIEIGDEKYKWTDFLEKVNAKILSVTDSEDKQMGEYFIKKSVDYKTFINKVMYYLWSEVGKDMFGSTKPFFELPEKTEDGKDAEKKQFSFNELFKENAIELLQGFMKKLEVKSEEEKAAEKAATTAPTAE